MNKLTFSKLFLGASLLFTALCSAPFTLIGQTPQQPILPSQTPSNSSGQTSFKIGVVSFRVCVDESKYGKQEQANFEALKKQMEAILEEKEKELDEISGKINDPDYIDILSSDAEKELKHKFRMMSQDIEQIRGQYYQALTQANGKILQKLDEITTKATEKAIKELALKAANEPQFDFVLREESCLYFTPKSDISKQVVVVMDEMYDKEIKENKNSPLK